MRRHSNRLANGSRRQASTHVGDVAAPEEFVGLLGRMSDGVALLGDDWRCRYINAPGARMLGRTPASLAGRPIWTAFPGAEEAIRAACERAVLLGSAVALSVCSGERRFDGQVVPEGSRVMILFRDVTELTLAQEELREYADRMGEAEQIVKFGAWKWELDAGRVRWSRELERIYGLAPGEFEGTPEGFVSRLHPDDRDTVWAKVEAAIAGQSSFVFEERIIRSDGEVRILLSKGRVVRRADGSPDHLIGVCHDVTERAAAERALGHSERRMRGIIDNTPSMITVKSLDGAYLMANAEAGRILGVDPDAVVGTRCDDYFPRPIVEQYHRNDRIAASEGTSVMDETILVRDGEPRTYVTVTFPLPDDEGRPAETCTIATDVTERRERETERRERLEFSEMLDAAIREERVLAYAQPVVELATGARTSLELLVRMRDAADPATIVAPAAFLPRAEQFGLVAELDLWMVREALALVATPAHRLQVNLSAVTMCDPDARRRVVEYLQDSPEAASGIVFEITETAAVEHLDAATRFARDVTALGCGLALDDFGTGFGAFTYLRALPLQYLKIDTSFVREAVASVHDRRVVQSVVAIAETFGVLTIAEGVEDERTLELLRELGVDLVQGYFLGRPAPAEQLLETLAA